MKCPSREGPLITKTEKNYINRKDKDGKIKTGHQILSECIPVYECNTCGAIWVREPDGLV